MFLSFLCNLESFKWHLETKNATLSHFSITLSHFSVSSSRVSVALSHFSNTCCCCYCCFALGHFSHLHVQVISKLLWVISVYLLVKLMSPESFQYTLLVFLVQLWVIPLTFKSFKQHLEYFKCGFEPMYSSHFGETLSHCTYILSHFIEYFSVFWLALSHNADILSHLK